MVIRKSGESSVEKVFEASWERSSKLLTMVWSAYSTTVSVQFYVFLSMKLVQYPTLVSSEAKFLVSDWGKQSTKKLASGVNLLHLLNFFHS